MSSSLRARRGAPARIASAEGGADRGHLPSTAAAPPRPATPISNRFFEQPGCVWTRQAELPDHRHLACYTTHIPLDRGRETSIDGVVGALPVPAFSTRMIRSPRPTLTCCNKRRALPPGGLRPPPAEAAPAVESCGARPWGEARGPNRTFCAPARLTACAM